MIKNTLNKCLLIISILLLLTISISCASNNQNTTSNDNSSNNINENISKSLVVYFSWSSSENTEKMANYISESVNADIYEIEALNPYPTDYTEATIVAREEKDKNLRPQIMNLLTEENISQYDVIFLGFPIWWHTAPMIIGTFLESYQLEDVDVYPFFQGASNSNLSYFEETMTYLRNCNFNANIHDGLYASSSDTNKIDQYLKNLSF